MTGESGRDAECDARSLLRGIYGIVDNAAVAEPIAFARTLLGSGVRVLQYRAKAGIDHRIVQELCRLAHGFGGRVIVNDDFKAALLADGWHAGQGDLAGRDVGRLRRSLSGRLFGISCSTPAQACAAQADGADYVGVGPFATSSTKVDDRVALGPAGIRAVVRATSLPVVAIGGISLANVAAVAATGAAMAAMIGALATASDPATAARELLRTWERATR